MKTSSEVLIDRLQEIPEEIKTLEQERFQLALDKADVEKRKSLIENEFKRKINEEVDGNGKKVFSNEASRKAEFERMSLIDSDLIEKNEKLTEIENRMSEISIETSYLSSTQSNFRAILHYTGG